MADANVVPGGGEGHQAQNEIPPVQMHEAINNGPLQGPAQAFSDPVFIRRILQYMSFHQLKTLRLTCKDMRNEVDRHPRFRNGAQFIDDRWYDVYARTYDHRLNYRWLTAKYENISVNPTLPFNQNFHPEDLHRVILTKCRMKCTNLARFFVACQNVQEITMDKVSFTTALIIQHRWDMAARTHKRFCFQEPVQMGGGFAPLRRITFKRMSLIPTCLTHILRQKCHGALEEFHFSDDTMSRVERVLNSPLEADVRGEIRQFVVQNSATIRKLTFQNVCRRSFQHLREILDPPRQAQMPLQELAIGSKDDASPSHPTDRNDTAVAGPNPYVNFINLPRYTRLETGLRRLSLEFPVTFDWQMLEPVLYNLAGLETLSLAFVSPPAVENPNPAEEQRQLDLGLNPGRMPTLKHFLVRNERGTSVNLNFLQDFQLPDTLTCLKLHVKGLPPLTPANWAELLSRPNAQQLTALHLGYCNDAINNEVVQAIIRNLANLEELHIRNSKQLTDEGICGIPQDTCNHLLTTKANIDWTNNLPQKDEQVCSPSLRNLKHLKTLDLAYCRKVTDVSIMSCFFFPHLKEVDLSGLANVSDLGLVYLARQNPCLEKLVLRENASVTKLGMAALHTRYTIATLDTIASNFDQLGDDIPINFAGYCHKYKLFGRNAPSDPTVYFF